MQNGAFLKSLSIATNSFIFRDMIADSNEFVLHYKTRAKHKSLQTMGTTIKNGQQPKPQGGLKALHWHQIFGMDSAVVTTRN